MSRATERREGTAPTIQDLAHSIENVEETLSEVLVLLYHVIQAHQDVIDVVRQQRTPSLGPSPLASLAPNGLGRGTRDV